jgi:primosomal protein N' (replication factor Y)
MPDLAEVAFNLPLDRTFTYRIPPGFAVRPGVRVSAPFGRRSLTGIVVELPESTKAPYLKDLESCGEDVVADERLLDLTRWLAARYCCSWGEALSAALPAGVRRGTKPRPVRLVSAGDGAPADERQAKILAFARSLPAPLPRAEFGRACGADARTVGALIRAGLLLERLVEPTLDALADAYVEKPKEIRLTPEQEEALRLVDQGGVILLHGVTGSGKTEVYLRALERCVAQGRQGIVLVPEIALTPQTVARFKSRFPRVAVLHSVLSESARAAQWRAARAGEVDVVIGARSAVFSPARALGLIVLDEEHEAAYKQENAPRYHAREVALERARREGATLLLGSATPSLESWHAAQESRWRLARLPRRIEGREMPEIELVDMAAESLELKRRPVVSRRLEQAVRDATSRREQVILFLNRRGFLTHVSCPRCRWFLRCRRCDVALTVHKKSGRASCHYCNLEADRPASCPACGFGGLRDYGIGTEKIQEEVERLFPGSAVSRMDSDSMKTRDDYREALVDLWTGETDILVGTQMIAKGLDVPDVTVVGVVSADTAFHLSDFRAAERTFQLITQVAGRTGRGPKGGRVVVQTFYPQHAAIKAAATYDWTGFANVELEHRKELGYPPYVRLVRIVVQGVKEERVAALAEELGAKLRATFDEAQARILGPAVPPLARLRGRHRRHLLVKAPELDPVLPGLRRLALLPGDPKLSVQVDVDPVNLL